MKLFGNSPSKRVEPEKLSEEEWDDSEAPDTEEEEEEGRTRRGLPNGVIMAISAFLVLVLVAAAGAMVVNYFLNLINYQSADSEYFPTVESEEQLPEETAINDKLAAIDEEEAGLEATPEELAQWQAQIDSIVSDNDTYEVPISEDVYNILLIGSDTREEGGVGRSDAMILVSINQKTKTIYLTSFLRDCYVYLPGWGHTRLNHAFAYEGPDLLEQTLEENFKVHVDKYVAVDFFSFMDIVDILGGIWIYVTDERKAAMHLLFQPKRICFNGHCHVPLIAVHRPGRRVELGYLHNTFLPKQGNVMVGIGSVGQPRDEDPRACAILFNTENLSITMLRVRYDVEAAQKRILDNGLPRCLARRISLGK